MKARQVAVELVRDVSLVGGLGSITYGTYLAWPPASWMVAGLAAVLLARGLMPGGPDAG